MLKNLMVTENKNLLSGIQENKYEIIAEFDVSNTDAQEFGFQIQKEGSENTKVSYNINKQQLSVDRTHSGSFNFGKM